MSKYQISQICFNSMLNQMKSLDLDTDSDSLYAMANMIKIVTDSMEFLDCNKDYLIYGFNVRRNVTGNVFESETLCFDDAVVLQINDSYDGLFINYVNVGAIISDTVINALLYITKNTRRNHYE